MQWDATCDISILQLTGYALCLPNYVSKWLKYLHKMNPGCFPLKPKMLFWYDP